MADTLEARLDEKLTQLRAATEQLSRAGEGTPCLTEEQRSRVRALAADFPAAWNHPDADPKLRKRLLRTVVREVVVEHQPDLRRLEVTLHWHGGVHTQVHVKKRDRRRGGAADLDLVETVRRLAGDGVSDAGTARVLNMQRTTTPRGLPWTQSRARSFRHQHQIVMANRPAKADYLTQNEAASYLGISRNGLLGLERVGAIARRQVTAFAPWRVERRELDSERVQALVRSLKANGRLPRGGCPEGQLSLVPETKGVEVSN